MENSLLRKYSLLLGISASLVFLLVATFFYPGGSQHDVNAEGYNWQHNYLSNLFSETAINGAANTARFWAVAGMLLLSISLGWFFVGFSNRIPQKSGARIVKYAGIAAMGCAFLTVTPYHDTMITVASTLALISIFYITMFVFKSRLHFHKMLSSACLLVLYGCIYIYYTNTFLAVLPLLQKVCLGMVVLWVLALEYFTAKEDFLPAEKPENLKPR